MYCYHLVYFIKLFNTFFVLIYGIFASNTEIIENNLSKFHQKILKLHNTKTRLGSLKL